MPVPRYEKGHLLKPLNQSKVDWLQAHWWSGQPIDLADIPTHCKERSLRSIAPGNLVEDSIVDEYCKLVMERDRMYYSQSEEAARFLLYESMVCSIDDIISYQKEESFKENGQRMGTV